MYPRSHYFVHYDEKEKKFLLMTLKMELVVFSRYPVFVGDVCVLRSGTEYLGRRNHFYPIFSVLDNI